jgi:hypothetical protein
MKVSMGQKELSSNRLVGVFGVVSNATDPRGPDSVAQGPGVPANWIQEKDRVQSFVPGIVRGKSLKR